MAKLIGRFYFKKTSNGNLIGEFSSNMDSKIYTESADKKRKSNSSSFLGKYLSTWLNYNDPIIADLDISYKYIRKSTVYKLKWKIIGDNIIYQGEGMLCDDILIGDYGEV